MDLNIYDLVAWLAATILNAAQEAQQILGITEFITYSG